MTVLQRAREISIMRLVGATDAFIRGPFLLDGALKGLLGGVLAVLLSRGAFELFRRNSTTALHTLVFFEPKYLLLGVLFGVAIGLGGSLVSVGRHLRNV
jgi:cell division transport system permease protein